MMNDIAAELAKLHLLKGADYSRQVERVARMSDFHPVEGETDIYSVGGESNDDYCNLLNAARKAVTHGYKVYILPNPSAIRTPDFIFEEDVHVPVKKVSINTVDFSGAAKNWALAARNGKNLPQSILDKMKEDKKRSQKK